MCLHTKPVSPQTGYVSIHMDSVSASWHCKWNFIELWRSSRCVCVLAKQVRPLCLLSQVRPAGDSLKVNRLKWQRWRLLYVLWWRAKSKLKDGTATRQRAAPYLSAPCNSPGAVSRSCLADSRVVFRAFVQESPEVMDRALLNEDEPIPGGAKVSPLCAFVYFRSTSPGRCSHLSWFSLKQKH